MGVESGANKLKISPLNWLSKYFIYIVVVLLVVVLSIVNKRFLSMENFYNILLACAPLFLVTIGMGFTLISKGIDMSVGSIALFSVALAAKASTANASIAAMILIIVGSSIVFGAVNGLINAWLKVYPLLTTLATMLIYKGIALAIIENKVVLMPDAWGEVLKGSVFIFPFVFILGLALALMFQFVISYTKFGRFVYAIGDNEKIASSKGIPIFWTKVAVYAISGLMAGIAGIIWSGQTMSIMFSFASGIEFKVVIAAVLGGISVIGGKGTILPGAMVGALIVSIVSNALILLDVDVLMVTVVNSAFLFVVVILDTFNNKRRV